MKDVMKAVALCALMLGAAQALAQAPNLEGRDLVLKAMPAGPVARVNGTDITQDEFASLYMQEIAILKNRAQRKDVPDGVRLETGLGCLRTLVQRELLHQAAVAEKVSIPEKDLQERWKAEIERMKKGFQQAQGKELTEDEILKLAGATREDAMAELRKALLIDAMRVKVADQQKIEPSAEEVKKFFNEHASDFKRAEKIHVNQIYVAYKPTGKPDDDTKKAEARQKLENALKRLQAGETFAGVAKAVSEAPDKEKGGDLGPMPATALPPFYVEAAKKLKPGEVSGIIESEFGFHVIKLIELVEGGAVTLEQAQPSIRQMLMGDKMEKALAKWCEPYMQKPGYVEIFLQIERILASRPELQRAAAESVREQPAKDPAPKAAAPKAAAPKTAAPKTAAPASKKTTKK